MSKPVEVIFYASRPPQVLAKMRDGFGGTRRAWLSYEEAHDLIVDLQAILDATCDKPSCDNHAEPNTSHGLCPDCLDARQTPPLTAYDVILGAPEGAL